MLTNRWTEKELETRWKTRVIIAVLCKYYETTIRSVHHLDEACKLERQFPDLWPGNDSGRFYKAICDKAYFFGVTPKALAAKLAAYRNVTARPGTAHRSFKDLATQVAQWLGIFAAVAYTSGFLAASIIFDRYGIRDAGTELVRARYVFVGIEFLLLPISLLLPLVLNLSRMHRECNRHDRERAIALI